MPLKPQAENSPEFRQGPSLPARLSSLRNAKRTLRRTTVQTWSYANGRGQNFYAWAPNWTLHIALIRKERSS